MSAMLTLSLYDDLLNESFEYEKPAPPEVTFRASVAFLLRGLGVADHRSEAILPPVTEAPS